MVADKLPHHQGATQLLVCSAALTVVLLAGCTLADFEHTCYYQSRPHPQGFCGPNLADIVSNLCRSRTLNNFYKHRVRRSPEKELEMDNRLKGISLEPKQAMSYLIKRDMTGIVCECCFNQCTVFELYQYCPNPNHGVGKRSFGYPDSTQGSTTVEDGIGAGYY